MCGPQFSKIDSDHSLLRFANGEFSCCARSIKSARVGGYCYHPGGKQHASLLFGGEVQCRRGWQKGGVRGQASRDTSGRRSMRGSANRSLSHTEPVSGTSKRKLENGELRLATETRRFTTKSLTIAGQRLGRVTQMARSRPVR